MQWILIPVERSGGGAGCGCFLILVVFPLVVNALAAMGGFVPALATVIATVVCLALAFKVKNGSCATVLVIIAVMINLLCAAESHQFLEFYGKESTMYKPWTLW